MELLAKHRDYPCEGLDGLNKPIVRVFPKLTVCLDCGVAQFKVHEKELQVLATGHAVDRAPVAGMATSG